MVEKKCNHIWEFIEKRLGDRGNQVYEFYCRHCLEIVTISDDGKWEVLVCERKRWRGWKN